MINKNIFFFFLLFKIFYFSLIFKEYNKLYEKNKLTIQNINSKSFIKNTFERNFYFILYPINVI